MLTNLTVLMLKERVKSSSDVEIMTNPLLCLAQT